MATRQYLAWIVAAACVASVGCASCMTNNMGCGCGVPVDCGCEVVCGCPEQIDCGCPEQIDCGCPEQPACGCADPSCGMYSEECVGCTSCGSGVYRGGGLISRMRRAIRGSYGGMGGCGAGGCGSEVYWSEWHNDPPCDCDHCDGGPCEYPGCSSCNAPTVARNWGGHRRSQIASRIRQEDLNLYSDDEFRFEEEDLEYLGSGKYQSIRR